MDHATIKSVLRDARALIATPDRWTQGAGTRDSEGNPIVNRRGAVACRCASWAIWECSGETAGAPSSGWGGSNRIERTRQVKDALLASIERHTGVIYYAVSNWNDDMNRTHAEVIRAFDWAIADEPQAAVTA